MSNGSPIAAEERGVADFVLHQRESLETAASCMKCQPMRPC
jgi:hypothetical protein